MDLMDLLEMIVARYGSNLYTFARTFFPRGDPLALDPYGGIETIDADSMLLFGYNVDGIGTSTDIADINLEANFERVNPGNDNVQPGTARYLLTDGTTGVIAGVGLGQTAANLELAANPFYREFTDTVPLTAQPLSLSQMQRSGAVRDLREAA